MPTIITEDYRNVVGTGAILSNKKVIQMDKKIHLLEPSKAPLMTFLTRLPKQGVPSSKNEWMEEERTPTNIRINGGTLTAGGTTWTVDDSTYVPVNSLIRVQRTGEVVLVTAVPTSTTLTVSRSYTTTAAAAILDNEQLTILGGAAIEGGTPEDSRSVQEAAKFNYIQIFTDPFGVSDITAGTELYGGKDLPHVANSRGIEHAVYMENAFLFGEKVQNTDCTGGRWATGGVDEFITTNRKAMGGTVSSLTSVYEHAQTVFRYGKKNKVLMMSRGLASNMSLLAAGRLEAVPADKTWGIHVERLQTPHGVWNLVTNDLMEGDSYGGYGFTLDFSNLQYWFMPRAEGMCGDTHIVTNVQANGSRFRKDEWRTYAGLKLKLEKSHGVMTAAA
jgi:hypothetical protein